MTSFAKSIFNIYLHISTSQILKFEFLENEISNAIWLFLVFLLVSILFVR